MEPEDELMTPPMEETPADYDNVDGAATELPYGGDGAEINLPPHRESAAGFDPSLLDDQTLMAELQRRQYLYQQQATNPPHEGEEHGAHDPRLAQIVKLSYTNPQMAEALRLQMAEERAEARVMQRIGPTIAPIAEREAIRNSGLSANAQQYLSETFAQMPGVDVAALMHNPLTRDVLTRAARQYENERSARNAPRYESAASEAPTLSAEDWRAIRDFEKMTGDRVDSDVVRNAKRGL